MSDYLKLAMLVLAITMGIFTLFSSYIIFLIPIWFSFIFGGLMIFLGITLFIVAIAIVKGELE